MVNKLSLKDPSAARVLHPCSTKNGNPPMQATLVQIEKVANADDEIENETIERLRIPSRSKKIRTQETK